MKKTIRNRKTLRTRIKKEALEESKEIPIYKKLYPPLRDIFLFDENNEIQNNLLKMKVEVSNIKKKKNFFDETEQEMDENFLKKLVKSPSPIPKPQIIKVMIKFIEKSKLRDKLEKDYQSAEKKNANDSIIKLCAEKFNYEQYEKGEIIFKIGDSGENFYFILSGNVSVLKLKEIKNIQMNYKEYLGYCIYLLNEGEEYLLNEVLKANESVLNVSSIEDIKLINKIVFLKNLNQIINKKITNNKQLKKHFAINGQKYSDYEIKQDELDYYEQQKLKGVQGASKEWEEYITKHCSLLVSDQVFFQSYEKVLTDTEQKNIKCFCYDPFLYLGPGLYFGDTSLDFEHNKRNATIRTESKTYLAYLQRDDYLSIISPMNKMERIKEVEFLYTKYFFLSINSHIFEKNFFHLFSHREYYHGSILFSQGSIPRSLILVKTGRITLELKCSIIDIQNLIKFIYDNTFLNPIFQRLSHLQKSRYMPPERISRIKSYINDPILTRLKTHNRDFINQMKIDRTYTLIILTDNEVIGLEEVFLRMPYITKATVINNKVDCYELSLENLDRLLNCGKDVIFSYTKYAINKISTLIERLQNIKQNYINMSLVKYDIKRNYDDIDDNNITLKSPNKEMHKKISRNSRNNFIDNELYLSNADRKTDEVDGDKMTFIAKNGQNSSSPIKIFMTSISPQSRSRIEELRQAFSKFQKIKINSNKNKTISRERIVKKKDDFYMKSLEFSRLNYINNKPKKNTKDSNNKTTSLIYSQEDKLNTKYLIDNILVGKKEQQNQTTKHNEKENESDLSYHFNINVKNNNTNKHHQIKENKFSLSYIPLNLILKREEKSKDKTNFNNLNDLLLTRKNIREILSMKNTVYFNNENNSIYDNKLDSKSKTSNIIMNNKRNNFKKRLIALNKKNNITNISKEEPVIKPNIISKKILITGIIKDFYKDIKLSGYSSVMKNKKINTIYMRKFNKKYDSAEKVYQNIKIQLLKESNSLPQIF